MTIAHPKVRMVRWLDSSLQNGQVDKDDFPTPVVIASIGFVVDETNGHITLARDDMGHDGDYRGLVSIPQRAVLAVERLAEHGQAETGVDSQPPTRPQGDTSRRKEDATP